MFSDPLITWQTFCWLGLSALVAIKFRSFGYFWVYCILNAIYFMFRPFDDFHIMPHGIDKLQLSSGQALAMLLIIPFFFAALKKLTLTKKIFLWLGAIDALLLFIFDQGFLRAHTFDGAFLAMMLPLAPVPLFLIFLAAIVRAKSMTAVCVILAQVLALQWRNLKGLLWGFLGALLLTQYFWLSGKKFIFVPERVTKWAEFFIWWKHTGIWHWLFGTGAGSYFYLSPFAARYEDPFYLQAHNDWVQILFEFGVVGFILALGTYVLLLHGATRKNKALLLGMGTCMMSYYPLHHFITACFCAYIVRLTLEDKNARVQ